MNEYFICQKTEGSVFSAQHCGFNGGARSSKRLEKYDPAYAICLWSAHKRSSYVEHVFHFAVGQLPLFTGADRSTLRNVLFGEQQTWKLEAQCEMQSLNTNSAEHLGPWLLQSGSSQEHDVFIWNHFAILCYFFFLLATESPWGLAVTRCSMKKNNPSFLAWFLFTRKTQFTLSWIQQRISYIEKYKSSRLYKYMYLHTADFTTLVKRLKIG